MEDWKGEKFSDPIFDTERCSRQHTKPRRKDGEDHTVAVFTRLLLCGQIRSVVRFITDRVSGGGSWLVILPLVFLANLLQIYCRRSILSHAVLVVMHFCLVTHFHPYLMLIYISADYVERVAHHIQGAAGPGGSTDIYALAQLPSAIWCIQCSSA